MKTLPSGKQLPGPPKQYPEIERWLMVKLELPRINAQRQRDFECHPELQQEFLSLYNVKPAILKSYNLKYPANVRVKDAYFDDGGFDPDERGWHLTGMVYHFVHTEIFNQLGFRTERAWAEDTESMGFEVIAQTPELDNEIRGIGLGTALQRAMR